MDALLIGGERIIADNTNRTPDERALLIAATRRAGVPVRAVWLDTPPAVCLERNLAREGRAHVSLPGILGTLRRCAPGLRRL